MAAMFGLIILLTSAISITRAPQDPPKKGKKHINVVRVENGKETKIDTVIGADQIFIWNSDTIGGDKELNWISEDGEFNFDSIMDFDVRDFGDGRMFVMKQGDSTKQFHIKMLGDDNMDIMKWRGDNDENVFFGAPPTPRRMMIMDRRPQGNVIDLSDPGIISYEKKDLKDGKEKIVIVREKPSPEEKEVHKEIIMHSDAPMMMHAPVPSVEKRIKVISDDGGNIKVMGDGDVWNIDKNDPDVKVIEKDGKKIIIKKSKEGDEMKVNVEVEENEEK